MGYIHSLVSTDLLDKSDIRVDFFDAINEGNLIEVQRCLQDQSILANLNSLTIADIARDGLAPSLLGQSALITALMKLSGYQNDFKLRIQIIEELLAAGANVNQRYAVSSERSYSPLHVAISWCNLSSSQTKQVLFLLSKYDVNPNDNAYYFKSAKDSDLTVSTKPLDYIHQTKDPVAIAERLIKAGANPALANEETKAFLPSLFNYLSCLWNSLFGSNPNQTNQDELSQLKVAAGVEVASYQNEIEKANSSNKYCGGHSFFKNDQMNPSEKEPSINNDDGVSCNL
jgi:hypothetical protein